MWMLKIMMLTSSLINHKLYRNNRYIVSDGGHLQIPSVIKPERGMTPIKWINDKTGSDTNWINSTTGFYLPPLSAAGPDQSLNVQKTTMIKMTWQRKYEKLISAPGDGDVNLPSNQTQQRPQNFLADQCETLWHFARQKLFCDTVS